MASFEYPRFDIRNDIELPSELVVAVPFVGKIYENVADSKYKLKTKVIDEGYFQANTIAEKKFIQINNTYLMINIEDLENVLVNFEAIFTNFSEKLLTIAQIKNFIILYDSVQNEIIIYNTSTNLSKSYKLENPFIENDINIFNIELDLTNQVLKKFYLNKIDITEKFVDIDSDLSTDLNDDTLDFANHVVFFNSLVKDSLFQQAMISNISILSNWVYNDYSDIENLMTNLPNFEIVSDVLWHTKTNVFEDNTEIVYIPFGLLDGNAEIGFNSKAIEISNVSYSYDSGYDVAKVAFGDNPAQTFEFSKNISYFGSEKHLFSLTFDASIPLDKNTISLNLIFCSINTEKFNILQTDLFSIFYEDNAIYATYKNDLTTKKLLYSIESLEIAEHVHLFIDIDKENNTLSFWMKSIQKQGEIQKIENVEIIDINSFEFFTNNDNNYLVGISNLRIFERIITDEEKVLLFTKEQPVKPLDRNLFDKNNLLDCEIEYLFDPRKTNNSVEINLKDELFIGDTTTSVKDAFNTKIVYADLNKDNFLLINNSDYIKEIDEAPYYFVSANIVSKSKTFDSTIVYNSLPVLVDYNIYLPSIFNINLQQNTYSFLNYPSLKLICDKIYASTDYNSQLIKLNYTLILNKLEKKYIFYINGVKILETEQFLLKENTDTNVPKDFFVNNYKWGYNTGDAFIYLDSVIFNTKYFNVNQIQTIMDTCYGDSSYAKSDYYENYINSFFDFKNQVVTNSNIIDNVNQLNYQLTNALLIFKNLPITVYFQNNQSLKISFSNKTNVTIYNVKLYDQNIDAYFKVFTDESSLYISFINQPARYLSNNIVLNPVTVKLADLNNLSEIIDLYVYLLNGILFVYIDNTLKYKAQVSLYNLNSYIIGGLNIEQINT